MPYSVLASGKSVAATANGTTKEQSKSCIFRRRHAQIVHRHGDRSPITSLVDEAYWAEQLIPATQLEEMAQRTHVISDGVVSSHKANGRGPFGKLTVLGLQQMVDLGTLLREELFGTNEPKVMDDGTVLYPHIFSSDDVPLIPSNIQVYSTSFERALQSVQGVLEGLFPHHDDTSKINIDAQHTNIMLPDPQPRSSQEQITLEDTLAARSYLQVREDELLPLAVHVTQALHPLLAADAHEACFGAKQLRPTSAESIEIEPLAWNQLAEICKCLSVRNKLPPNVGEDDHHAIVQHAAWRWFETFRHPRLAWLGMHSLCERMVDSSTRGAATTSVVQPLTLYSAHDSTLIGLLCAFKLEQPVQWPEYGSYWMMELLEEEVGDDKNRFYVRFSLNGEVLRHMWDGHSDETNDMILLDRLVELLKNEGKATEGMGWIPLPIGSQADLSSQERAKIPQQKPNSRIPNAAFALSAFSFPAIRQLIIIMATRRIITIQNKAAAEEGEEDFTWVFTTLVRMSLLVIFVVVMVAGSLLNCYIEQRRDESRALKREREK